MIENIDEKFKNVIFSLNSYEQKKLLKLYNNYKNIKLYNNYEDIENDLYIKYSVNSIEEKIHFELQRISKFIYSINDIDSEFINRLNFIIKTFMFTKTLKEENLENIFKDIINNIILLEIDLNMKIGLYSELCEYFESEVQNKYVRSEERVYGYKKGYGLV